MSADQDSPAAVELPLFPLGSVLFPGGLLGLKVFEARYLDLVSRCLRSGEGFGVVALRQGSEVRRAEEEIDLEPIGTVAEIIDVDSPEQRHPAAAVPWRAPFRAGRRIPAGRRPVGGPRRLPAG
jgi:Lon protease-like protein